MTNFQLNRHNHFKHHSDLAWAACERDGIDFPTAPNTPELAYNQIRTVIALPMRGFEL